MEATELERVRKYAQAKAPLLDSVMGASGLRGGAGEMEWDEREWDNATCTVPFGYF